ncbi:MAG: alkaline phosphatase [Granulosicoccus sp.]
MTATQTRPCHWLALTVSTWLVACSSGTESPSSGDSLLANANYDIAAQLVSEKTVRLETRGAAKNIILFVGDGMGLSTVTAARILEGQNKGRTGEENQLGWGLMPFAGLSKTYNVDAQTADSAGTMSAIMTGVKTDAGVFGVDEDVERGQCITQAGNELITALELAEIAGMSTGIVSTARITHATPAATYAKSVDRAWENNEAMPAGAVAQGCTDIAMQLINFEERLEAQFPGLDVDGLEVAMGGGRRNFLPNNPALNSSDTESFIEGARTDGMDLTRQWQSKYPQGSYITDQAGFNAINANEIPRVLALFDESHMEYEANRFNDLAGEPSLSQMTAKAIDLLDNKDTGYFLSVEAGRIDHAHHAGSAFGALTDTIEFSNAVRVAMDASDPADTLIIVTADHSHVFTIGGFAKRGNPILGLSVPIGQTAPAVAEDNMPYTTLAYANGLGFRDFGENTDFDSSYSMDPDAGRKDLSNVDTTSSGFHQETLVPLSSETHGGEDVGVYARGPGASLVTGTAEQSVLFHVMEFAADLEGRANAVLNSR